MTAQPSNQHNAAEVQDIGKWTIYVFPGFAANVIDCYYLDVYVETLTVPAVFEAESEFRHRIAWLEEEFTVELEKIRKAS